MKNKIVARTHTLRLKCAAAIVDLLGRSYFALRIWCVVVFLSISCVQMGRLLDYDIATLLCVTVAVAAAAHTISFGLCCDSCFI